MLQLALLKNDLKLSLGFSLGLSLGLCLLHCSTFFLTVLPQIAGTFVAASDYLGSGSVLKNIFSMVINVQQFGEILFKFTSYLQRFLVRHVFFLMLELAVLKKLGNSILWRRDSLVPS